jgi:hypothetical protein
MLDGVESRNLPRFARPSSSRRLTKAERERLLRDYFEHYRSISAADPDLLSQKLPRDCFDELLTVIGGILQRRAADLAVHPGPVRDFLERNTLPASVAELLPPDFRAFCLALNALKQWVAAEQQATDRYLLGGNARGELRNVAGTCVATGRALESGCELHHPVRDGRPPIPLCPDAHDKIEKQQSKAEASDDPNFPIIAQIRRETHNSWLNLRKGCQDLLGAQVSFETPAVRAGARAFVRKVINATGLSLQQIIDFLDSNDLGLE